MAWMCCLGQHVASCLGQCKQLAHPPTHSPTLDTQPPMEICETKHKAQQAKHRTPAMQQPHAPAHPPSHGDTIPSAPSTFNK
eukprot:1143391-Pelagomonas_calceolata.AAC.12